MTTLHPPPNIWRSPISRRGAPPSIFQLNANRPNAVSSRASARSISRFSLLYTKNRSGLDNCNGARTVCADELVHMTNVEPEDVVCGTYNEQGELLQGGEQFEHESMNNRETGRIFMHRMQFPFCFFFSSTQGVSSATRFEHYTNLLTLKCVVESFTPPCRHPEPPQWGCTVPSPPHYG